MRSKCLLTEYYEVTRKQKKNFFFFKFKSITKIIIKSNCSFFILNPLEFIIIDKKRC